MGHSWKEREKVGNKAQTWIKRVTLGKIGEIWKNVSHLEHLEKWVALGKTSHIWKRESQFVEPMCLLSCSSWCISTWVHQDSLWNQGKTKLCKGAFFIFDKAELYFMETVIVKKIISLFHFLIIYWFILKPQVFHLDFSSLKTLLTTSNFFNSFSLKEHLHQ